MKQPGGGHGAAVRARRARRRHRARRIPSRSTCSAPCGGWRWRSASGTSTSTAARITELLELKVPGRAARQARAAAAADGGGEVSAARAERAPACQEVVWRGDEIDLAPLPIITCWPEDGGPYITLPMVISRDPVRGIRNVGMYRVQVLDRAPSRCTGSATRSAPRTGATMAERGETMPVCIAIGADPASVYAARAPLPPTVDEFLFAGFLRQLPVSLASARDVRPRGAGRRRVRDRGVHRSARAAGHRGAVRRPHRVLLGGGSVSRACT